MPSQALSGVGAGLRGPHVPAILQQAPAIAWFEFLTDNHLADGGALRFQADAIAERYPVALHSVNMNIAGFDPLDEQYLKAVKTLARRTHACHISDHLAVTAVNGQRANDLLPFPRTQQALVDISHRVDHIQERLQHQLLLENASVYLEFAEPELSEMAFLNELAARTGCGILLDVNNIYVSAHNLKEDPWAILEEVNWQHVKEIHVAGHANEQGLLIDTHNGLVGKEVLDMLAACLPYAYDIPILFEWDKQLPPWETIEKEVRRLESFCLTQTQQARQNL